MRIVVFVVVVVVAAAVVAAVVVVVGRLRVVGGVTLRTARANWLLIVAHQGGQRDRLSEDGPFLKHSSFLARGFLSPSWHRRSHGEEREGHLADQQRYQGGMASWVGILVHHFNRGVGRCHFFLESLQETLSLIARLQAPRNFVIVPSLCGRGFMGKRCGEELARNNNRGVVKEEGARSDASGFIAPNGNPRQLDSRHLRWNEDEVNCGLDPSGPGEGWGQWSPGVGGHKARGKEPLMHRPPGFVLFASVEGPDRVVGFFSCRAQSQGQN